MAAWRRETWAARAALASWYEAARGAAPGHLVSVGLSGSAALATWDPRLLAADLVTFHAFPEAGWSAEAQALYGAEHGWMASLGRPWLVTRTGLATGDAELEAAQHAAATAALGLARDCGALGLGWWTYRDGLGGDAAPQQFGLVRVDGAQKPAAAVFAPFDLGAPAVDACPAVGVASTAGAAAVVTGRLLDDKTGIPVAWARVTGTSCVDPNQTTHTFTRADGRFTLVGSVGIMQVTLAASGYANPAALWPACQSKDLGDRLLTALALPALPAPPSCGP